MTKRQKFIVTSLVLAVGLVLIQFSEISFRYTSIAFLTILAACMTAWSLREALGGIRWITAIILPSLFTAAVGLFYFLLPSTWISRLPIATLFALGMYALLLTENIFSVAAIRTIQLFRAATAVGFLLTLVTAFLLYDTVFSFRFPFYLNAIYIFLVSLPLFFQALWSVNLEEKISKRLVLYSCLLSLVMLELALIISFYPLTISMSSLFLTTGVYVLMGLVQAYFSDRLFRQTVYEYLGVGALVFVTMLLTARWGS
ncbi:MAG: hypothetical protein Q8P91_00690 [bacterium]|nr:hypothetical protein [bacterium]